MAGRLIEATFAMTPQTGQTGYSPSYPAGSRGRAFYQYDAGGRLLSLQHYWDVWNGSNGYTPAPILANSCVYDPVKNQKVQSTFWSKDPSANLWHSDRTEAYQYDPNTDYLTQADYGDGLANAVQNWTYDAAGNRASDDSNPGTWAYDALNRMTASPGLTYTNDLAGNRVARSDSIGYGWDALSRMTSYSAGGCTTNYLYRSDGMRTGKSAPNTSTTYRYDHDINLEEDIMSNESLTTTTFACGARGIDEISKDSSKLFPIYDSHGNMVATIARTGFSCAIANSRSYDAWGTVRLGSATGGPSSRYTAMCLHKTDDESGLMYMRARYYDRGASRFLSEDPNAQGSNWYLYCRNEPIDYYDESGREGEGIGFLWQALHIVAFGLGTTCGIIICNSIIRDILADDISRPDGPRKSAFDKLLDYQNNVFAMALQEGLAGVLALAMKYPEGEALIPGASESAGSVGLTFLVGLMCGMISAWMSGLVEVGVAEIENS